MEERELILLLKQGSKDAFTALYIRGDKRNV